MHKGLRERYLFYKKTGKLPYKNGRIDEELMYRERMKDVARENYEQWGYENPADAWQDAINDPTYDYRGYYSDPLFQNANANSETHWPDKYKTPRHETFSNESKYHGKQSDKNPYGLRGGMWIGDKFVPAAWQNPILIPHYTTGLDGEEQTDALAVRNRLIPLEVLLRWSPVFALKRLAALEEANARSLAAVNALNQTLIGTAQHVPLQLLEYYANQEDTRRFMLRKREGEELADKIFGTVFDVATMYAPAAKLAFGAAKQVGKRVVKMTTNAVERVGSAVNKAIDNGGFALSTPYLGDYLASKGAGKFTAWIPFDRPWSKGISWMATGKPTLDGVAVNGKPTYNGIPVEMIKSKYPGEGRKLYDVGIKIAQDNGYDGLLVGDHLISAPKSYRTFEHYYPDRTYLDDFGLWSNKNMIQGTPVGRKSVYSVDDFMAATAENPKETVTFVGAPRYRLERPSTEVSTTTPRGLLSDEPLIARGIDNPAGLNIYKTEGRTSLFEEYLNNAITHSSLEGLRLNQSILPILYEGRVVDKPTPEEVRLIFYNSVLPRMRNMRAGWHGGLLRPTVKSNVDAALDRGYSVYDKSIWDKSSMKDFAGFQNSETGHIAIKDGFEDFALGHEYRHRLDRLLPKSPTESDILENAYDSDFLKLSEYYPELKDVRMAHEAITTNFDARIQAIGKKHAIDTDWKLQNKIISKLSDDKIIDAVRNANGYGRKYIEWLEEHGKLATDEMKKAFADKHRDAMRFVGAFGIPAALTLPQLNK